MIAEYTVRAVHASMNNDYQTRKQILFRRNRLSQTNKWWVFQGLELQGSPIRFLTLFQKNRVIEAFCPTACTPLHKAVHLVESGCGQRLSTFHCVKSACGQVSSQVACDYVLMSRSATPGKGDVLRTSLPRTHTTAEHNRCFTRWRTHWSFFLTQKVTINFHHHWPWHHTFRGQECYQLSYKRWDSLRSPPLH